MLRLPGGLLVIGSHLTSRSNNIEAKNRNPKKALPAIAGALMAGTIELNQSAIKESINPVSEIHFNAVKSIALIVIPSKGLAFGQFEVVLGSQYSNISSFAY